jgi:hypothetical protein
MAQLYVPYALGSMAFAAVSKWLYDYSNGAEETIEVESDKEIISIPEIKIETEPEPEVIEEGDLYECMKCHQLKNLDNFSKNQQKKKPMNMWKCKSCTICK